MCVSAGFSIYAAVHAACGLRLLRRGPLFKVRMGKLESLLVGFLLGMGLDAVLLFALATLGVPLRVASALILIGLTWLGRRELADLGRTLVTTSRGRAAEYRLKTAMWWGAFGAIGFEAFLLKPIRVASPPHMFDATMIHLAAAKCYVVRDAMPFLPQIRSSHLIPLIQCQFTSVMMIFGELGPKLLEGAYYIGLGVCTYTFAQRAGVKNQDGSRLAALLVFATPMAMKMAGSCYLGMPATVFMMTAFALALRWRRPADDPPERSRSLAALTGVFLAFTFLAKVQAWGVAFPALLVVLASAARRPIRRHARRTTGRLGWTCLVGALAVAPYLIRNTIAVGNPFAPLFSRWLGINDDIMSLAEYNQLSRTVGSWGMGHGLLDFLALPARLVLEEWHFGGSFTLGVCWLIALPLGVIGLFRRRLWWALPFLLCFVIPWFFVFQEIRYLVYLLPVAAVLGASGVVRLWPERGILYATLGCGIILSACLQSPALERVRGTLSLGGRGRENFLRSRVIGYDAARWLSARTDDTTRVYQCRLDRTRYFFPDPGNVLGDWYGKYRYASVVRARGGLRFLPASDVVSALRQYGVRYLMLSTGGSRVAPSLRFRSDQELSRHLSLLTEIGGSLIYEFDPSGSFPAVETNDGINLIENPDFRERDHSAWGGGDVRVKFDHDAGRATLPAKAQLTQFIALEPGESGLRYWFELRARSLEEGKTRLRLQAVWLPEGGWNVKDADGRPLRVVQIKSVQPETGEESRFEALFSRSPHAVSLALSLVNDGEIPVTVTDLSLVRSRSK